MATKTHSALMERLKKTSKLEGSAILSESKLFDDRDVAVTDIPMMNVALSGQVDGGLTSGFTVIAGNSKHFKSCFSLIMVAAYMKKHKDAVCLFYDSEFGAPKSYFATFGIDISRVIHNPIKDIEELKFDVIAQLNEIHKGDKVIILIDSLGNVASKKELEDAINEKSVADMSRAKAMKGLFRMVTPYLSIKDIPMVAIAHTYDTMELYSKAIVSGGKGIYYSANTIWIIGRQQDKDADGLNGYNFIINVEKSRFVREKSKIPINVTFEGGVQKYSGLLDVAIELGYVIKPSQGFYQSFDPATKKELSGKLRADATNDAEFWDNVFGKTDFAEALRKRYQLGTIKALHEDVIVDDDDSVET